MIGLVPVVVALCGSGVAGAEPRALDWKLAVEAGAECDSNMHRLEVSPDADVDIAGALWRGVGRACVCRGGPARPSR